jgi:c-di-GMP-related signal transduction protein
VEKFLARQPIFDSYQIVYGYEMLFRSGPENLFDFTNPDAAAASTADNLILFGIDRLTQGRRAFMNCTRDILVRDFLTLIPNDRIVVEVLETVRIDDELVTACHRLKQAGYLLALDDFRDGPEWGPLVKLADFIKVDVLATPVEEQQRLAQAFANTNVRLLAEKVETHADFKRTLGWGYKYFQGYFFSRPEMVKRYDIPASKLNNLLVLQAANKVPVDLHDVGERIKAEPSLSYRLLRYLNSPAFPLIVEVHSIPHALSLLGERGVRKWVSLVAVAAMGEEKPAELVALPLVRARFCELLAPYAGLPEFASDLFLLGLLSAMDAILDMKMVDVLKEITIHEGIRDALLGRENALRKVFDLALKYEMGAWDGLCSRAKNLKIPEDLIPDLYLRAVEWSSGLLSGRDMGKIEAT